MNKELLKVALRQRAIYIPKPLETQRQNLTAETLSLVNSLRELGFALSEDALTAVNTLNEDERQTLLDAMNEVMGTKLNWASLVRGWLVPTGETVWDHFITLLANIARSNGEGDELKGTTLPCGHFIPEGTFPLERYNGCPFCGTPFHTANFVYKGQGSKLKMLNLWTEQDMEKHYDDLLHSPVPLDATQRESLKQLLHSPFAKNLSADSQTPIIKETVALIVDELVAMGRDEEAGRFFTSPNDILRYLWYRHTGHIQILTPATILHTKQKNFHYEWNRTGDTETYIEEERKKLKLKYDRTWCRRVALWLNTLTSSAANLDSLLEQMHPKREMWVRFIRALRLAEYSRKKGFGPLDMLLDRFYRRDYPVWQGRVDHYRLKNDADETLTLLRQRPGLFARCLFSTMLTFGEERVIKAFSEVTGKLSPRLLLTLGSQAQLYFDRNSTRVARPLSGVMKNIPPHPLLMHYNDELLRSMSQAVTRLYLDAMKAHFKKLATDNGQKTIYIDPQLYNIPVAVADRTTTIQDISAALQGTRFPVQGDRVRLFLQWGKDLPAQHLDMDLSCYILIDPQQLEGKSDTSPHNDVNRKGTTVCSYFSLSVPGATHSGDIRRIPDMVGTAEYIELSIPELLNADAHRVVFTCNAYTRGALSPNLMVGWMSAEEPMTVSEENGVAYDPSTVDHIVRISEANLTKGLIFGVLDVAKREITWLEMPFDGQTVMSISPKTVDAYLKRLQAKPTIGQLLDIMAEARNMEKCDTPENASEVYDTLWAQNPAQVSKLLLA